MSHDLYPTHTCFDDALDLLVVLLKAVPEAKHSLRLVHGIVKPPDFCRYAHAWVEDLERGRVYFMAIQDGERRVFAAPTGEYYAEMRVEESTRYSYKEAYAMNRLTEHYGPWKQKYRELCRQKGKA